MKIVLIGQAPSRHSIEPFGGRSGDRLAALSGMAPLAFRQTYERLNLLTSYPGKVGKGDAFPRAVARLRAADMVLKLLDRRVVLVGAGVAAAFRVDDLPILTWVRVYNADFAICPHPSGINRWWNDPDNAAAARAFWTGLAGHPGDGAGPVG